MLEKNSVVKVFVLILFGVLLSVVSCISTDVDTLAVICFIQCIVSLLVVLELKFGIVSIPFLFIGFTWFFHGSQFFLNVFGFDYEKPFDISRLVDSNICVITLRYTTVAFILLLVGFIMGKSRSPKKNKQQLIYCGDDRALFIGKILIIICLIPRLYIDTNMIISRMSNGYLATYNNSYSGIFDVLAYGFYVGIVCLLVGKRNDKKFCNRVIVFVLAYLLVTMLSGRRGTQICILLSILLIYIRYIGKRKLKARQYILILATGYFVLCLLMTFGDLRILTNVSINEFMELFGKNIRGQFLADMIGEFGGTGISLAYAIKSFPDNAPFNYGKSYIISFLQVFPNIGGVLDSFTTDFMFTKAFPNTIQFALGGSYLGELYYNFGSLGVMACIPIGALIAKLTVKLDDALSKNSNIALKNLAILLIIPNLFIWIRGYFYSFIRIYFWYRCVFYILASIKNKQTSKYYVEETDEL